MRALAVLVLAAACGSSGPVKIDEGVRIEYSLDLAPGTDRNAAAADAVRVIKRRIERGGIKANAVARGEAVVIDLAGGSADDMARAKDLFARTGKLEVKVVDSGDEVMQRLYTLAKQDPHARDNLIGAELEHWRAPSGDRDHTDWYLTALERPLLASYIAELLQQDTTLAIPDDRQLGYERVDAAPGDLRKRFWRTYLLERTIVLANRDIESSEPFIDTDGRPAVRIELTDQAARAFGELTGRIVGTKIAILIDDRVVSAPIIASAIDRGRITLATDEPKVLAFALASGPLPAPMREERVSQIDHDSLIVIDEQGNQVRVPR